MTRCLTFAVILTFVAALASAQTVVNPTKVEFPASPDHAVVVSGTPVVLSYELNCMKDTVGGALAFTFNLGKPTPNANNLIGPLPVANFLTLTRGSYVCTASALGQQGTAPGVSPASDPFAETGPAGAPGKPVLRP